MARKAIYEEHCEEVCKETADAMLFTKIREDFREDADEIIGQIIFGRSTDAAIQSLFM